MALKKISSTIQGHRTSVSLEPEFYEALVEIAKERDIPLARLVVEVDEARGDRANLSSALRVFVLKETQKNA